MRQFAASIGTAIVIIFAVAAGRISNDVSIHIAKNDEITLHIPQRVVGVVGEPIDIVAITQGRKVVWHSENPRLGLKHRGDQTVEVWSEKPGTYMLLAYTVTKGNPTPIERCEVVILTRAAIPMPSLSTEQPPPFPQSQDDETLKPLPAKPKVQPPPPPEEPKKKDVYVVIAYNTNKPPGFDTSGAKSLLAPYNVEFHDLATKEGSAEITNAGLMPYITATTLPALIIVKSTEGGEGEVKHSGRLPGTVEEVATIAAKFR